MPKSISDYSDYDYKSEFWEKSNREYENLCEQKTLQKLISKIPKKLHTILDAGCGFGRLYPSYCSYADSFILIDFAKNMLSEAKKILAPNDNILFINADMYQIPLESNSIDLVLSIRTLHHISDPNAFFKEINRVLAIGSHFIVEIPNKKHLRNIFRFLTGKINQNPFSDQPYKISNTFYNYSPNHIKKTLLQNNFNICQTTNLSFFRSVTIKKFINARLLCKTDLFLQKFLSFLNLTPSIYVLCQKFE